MLFSTSLWFLFLCFFYILLYSALPLRFFTVGCFHFEIFLPEIVLKAGILICTPLPYYHISLLAPPLFSWFHVLHMLCDQFLFLPSSPLCGDCLLFFCAFLVSAFFSNISLLLYFAIFFLYPGDFCLQLSLQPHDEWKYVKVGLIIRNKVCGVPDELLDLTKPYL